MHYYSFQAFIYANDQRRDALSLLYKSESPANICEFKKHVEEYYAGAADTYSGIVISGWQEIFESTYHKLSILLEKI